MKVVVGAPTVGYLFLLESILLKRKISYVMYEASLSYIRGWTNNNNNKEGHGHLKSPLWKSMAGRIQQNKHLWKLDLSAAGVDREQYDKEALTELLLTTQTAIKKDCGFWDSKILHYVVWIEEKDENSERD